MRWRWDGTGARPVVLRPDTWSSSADAVILRRDGKMAGRLSLQVVVVAICRSFEMDG